MALYPSERWLDEYARRLDESRAFDDVATGWGEGFNGDIQLVITDLPLSDTPVGALPERVLDGVPRPYGTNWRNSRWLKSPRLSTRTPVRASRSRRNGF